MIHPTSASTLPRYSVFEKFILRPKPNDSYGAVHVTSKYKICCFLYWRSVTLETDDLYLSTVISIKLELVLRKSCWYSPGS